MSPKLQGRLVVTLCLGLLWAGWAQAAPARLRTLILSGSNNHEWQQTTPALQRLLEDSGRFRVDITNDPASCDAAALSRYDLVVSNWNNFPSEERVWGATAEGALVEFVRSGKGLALFHAAGACFPAWPEYQQMIGATWLLNTTGHGQIHAFDVSIADREHPITKGMQAFSIRDELWHRMARQADARVLCTAFSATETGGSGQDEPVALVTQFGQGRCFNLVLGHDVAAMAYPGWGLLMLRGCEWAATGEATITALVDPEAALDAVAGYSRYGDRAPLVAVETLVQQAATDPTQREALAARVAARLGSEATSDCKAFLLQQLALVGGDPEVAAIAALVPDESVRDAAIAALERLPGKAAAAALRQALPVLDGVPLAGAINALAARRDADSVPAVSHYLASTDETVAGTAINALGSIGGSAATAALRSHLPDAPTELRPDVARALLRCADGLAAVDRESARAVYGELDTRDQPDQVRLAAFVGLVRCAQGDRAELLLRAYRSHDPVSRAGAVQALRTLRDNGPAARVAQELGSLRPEVQVPVIEALGDLGAPSAASGIAGLVSSDSPAVRLAAIGALGGLGDASVCAVLLEALRGSPAEAEREAATTALAAICARAQRGGGALPFSYDGLAREDAPTRNALLRALGLAAGQGSLAVLRTALRDPSADTRLAAIGALGEWPDGEPLPDVLATARQTAEPGERDAALRSLAALVPRALATPEATVHSLAEAMALAGDAAAKRSLLDSLGLVSHPAALALAVAGIADPEVGKDACLAAVRVAEGLPAEDKDAVQAALGQVLNATPKGDPIRTRAKAVLVALGVPVEVTRSAPLQGLGPNLAAGAQATSPDGLEKDGDAGGDAAAVDGDPATYWDEVDNQPEYRLRVTFAAPQLVSALRIAGFAQHNYAPRDFAVLCDGQVVRTVEEAFYEANQFATTFEPVRCTEVELKIIGCYGASPAIRELELLGPAQ